jgi:hypothetical protein
MGVARLGLCLITADHGRLRVINDLGPAQLRLTLARRGMAEQHF